MHRPVASHPHRSFWQSVAALVGLLLLGTAGFGLLEGMGALDALYMAVITLSTVGFGEVRPLSPGGKFFTIGLILGAGWLAMYLLGGLADFLLSGEGRAYWQKRRLLRMLDKLSNHVIAAATAGWAATWPASWRARPPFVVIDPLPEKISQVGQLGFPGAPRGWGQRISLGSSRNRASPRTAGSCRFRCPERVPRAQRAQRESGSPDRSSGHRRGIGEQADESRRRSGHPLPYRFSPRPQDGHHADPPRSGETSWMRWPTAADSSSLWSSSNSRRTRRWLARPWSSADGAPASESRCCASRPAHERINPSPNAGYRIDRRSRRK